MIVLRLSILVISKTPHLLSEMLSSLSEATSLLYEEVEILCSWNGLQEDESKIINNSGYEFLIAKRTEYHFAENMNSLANLAQGEFLLLINDDLILDKNSLDSAINFLEKEKNAGLVGGILRDNNQKLTHAGISFDRHNNPYHHLDRIIDSNHPIIFKRNFVVPAVTGALMLVRRDNFVKIKFNNTFKVCGEDVELCLDIREKLKLEIFCCFNFSGIHESETTRKDEHNQQGNQEDLVKLRARRGNFIKTATKDQILNELLFRNIEIDSLRIELDEQTQIEEERKQERKQEQAEAHSFQLSRISLNQQVYELKRKLAKLNNDIILKKENAND